MGRPYDLDLGRKAMILLASEVRLALTKSILV